VCDRDQEQLRYLKLKRTIGGAIEPPHAHQGQGCGCRDQDGRDGIAEVGGIIPLI
jgi:hypothetical protein